MWQRMRVKCGDWSLRLGGKRVAYFSSPLWSSLHLTQCRSVVAIKFFQRSLRRLYGQEGFFFLFTLDHPFGWLCVPHSPFSRSTSRPFLFLYMGSSSCSNNKHKSQPTYIHVTSQQKLRREGFFWPLHRALSTWVAQNVLFHPSISQPSPWFLSFEETLLLSPPLGSYLLLPWSLFLPHPFWLCSSNCFMCGAYLSKKTAGAKKKPFFYTQGVIKKGVLLDSTPFFWCSFPKRQKLFLKKRVGGGCTTLSH